MVFYHDKTGGTEMTGIPSLIREFVELQSSVGVADNFTAEKNIVWTFPDLSPSNLESRCGQKDEWHLIILEKVHKDHNYLLRSCRLGWQHNNKELVCVKNTETQRLFRLKQAIVIEPFGMTSMKTSGHINYCQEFGEKESLYISAERKTF